ncbi:hypothetical protein Y032_0083g1668 [Ancylostoma ceylanicum]|uniref:Uncharacterized protein n=1 Tax=Ancylostoma ceylanicum TaxID=53326 RepID=A0A016TRJ1_9BILA|nr:hypothetical protein Y032_0083g1668 [Ancylostoma ceylanicum]
MDLRSPRVNVLEHPKLSLVCSGLNRFTRGNLHDASRPGDWSPKPTTIRVTGYHVNCVMLRYAGSRPCSVNLGRKHHWNYPDYSCRHYTVYPSSARAP